MIRGLIKSILIIYMFSVFSAFPSQKLVLTTDKNLQDKFIKAQKLLSKGESNSVQYKQLYNNLHYYPLQPYLDQQRLKTNLSLTNANEINQFLAKYRSTPLDWPLRKPWLRYLAKKNNKLLFLQAFKTTVNVELTCYHLQFQLAAGMPKSVILPQVTKLWVVGKSQDNACDPLFKLWQESGYRTNNIVWQRISLAANGGSHTLIPYLTKLLSPEKQYLARLWHTVRRDPSAITNLELFPNNDARETDILTYGFKRLIWRKPDTAIHSYEKSQHKFTFSTAQKNQITEKFAIALAAKNHKKAKEWLAKLKPNALSKSMLQWRLSQTLKQQNWQQLIIDLKALPNQQRKGLKWKYWYAQALIKTDEVKRGKYLLEQLATERHYYGFLAASYLRTPSNIKDQPLSFTLAQKQQIISYPAAKRAFEFYSLGQFRKARSEWNFLMKQLTKKEKLIAAKIANENKWFDRAIFTLANVGYLDDVNLRFPRAFETAINHYATAQKISPEWAFAIARRESSFMTDANSSAGAKGLMQLMPGTARELTKEKISRNYLLDAGNNVQLGTRYLKILLDKNKGNQVLATASYNAGPHRIKTWLKNTKKIAADIWIETIPFRETRNYVKSVLAYQEIYQYNPKQVSRLFERVINMKIGAD